VNLTAVLRPTALLLAAIAVLDPGCTVRRRAPVSVEIRNVPRGSDLRERLSHSLGAAADFDSASKPGAIVLAGGRLDVDSIESGVPVSAVLPDASAPNVSIASATWPGPLRPGWTAEVLAVAEGKGMAGQTTAIALEDNGVELAVIQHRWSSDDERFEARLPYVPAAPGVRPVRIVARAVDGEATSDDNYLASMVTVEDRRLRVLVHEPRPSWAAAFVRRALEADAAFDVAALTHVSKGVEVRVGEPSSLSVEAMTGFDAVVVGAPEELQSREVDALESFARRRGGTVALVPDRRPSGAYVSLLRLTGFDEALFSNPSAVAVQSGPPLRGSEFVVAERLSPGVESLAWIDQAGTTRPVVVSWLHGAGRLVFSGALDAWRYRAADEVFSKFWRAQIGVGAATAPARLELTLEPALAAPGDEVELRARIRGTEFDERAPAIEMPAMTARVMGGGGFERGIRMWPSVELGAFEARFEAPSPGRYDVQVRTRSRASVDVVLVVSEGARSSSARPQALRTLAAATGGVAVTEADLAPLENHLRGLPHAVGSQPLHPARSAWWTMSFVALVCAEWAVRRKRGLR
jgi:hypothetical protein